MLKFTMFFSVFKWTFDGGQHGNRIGSDGSDVMTIRGVFVRLRPAMRMEETFKIGFTGDLDVIPCLMCVSTIKALTKARVSGSVRKAFNCDVFIEDSDKIAAVVGSAVAIAKSSTRWQIGRS